LALCEGARRQCCCDGRGADMKTRRTAERINARPNAPRADAIAVGCEPIGIAISRRARLMG
jgi:hypothetical protein